MLNFILICEWEENNYCEYIYICIVLGSLSDITLGHSYLPRQSELWLNSIVVDRFCVILEYSLSRPLSLLKLWRQVTTFLWPFWCHSRYFTVRVSCYRPLAILGCCYASGCVWRHWKQDTELRVKQGWIYLFDHRIFEQNLYRPQSQICP